MIQLENLYQPLRLQEEYYMNLWKDIPTGPSAPEVIYAVVEIPKGSRNKYEYDKDMEAFALDRVLYSPFHYPAEYGIIPKHSGTMEIQWMYL